MYKSYKKTYVDTVTKKKKKKKKKKHVHDRLYMYPVILFPFCFLPVAISGSRRTDIYLMFYSKYNGIK